jgi:hypothetical protein
MVYGETQALGERFCFSDSVRPVQWSLFLGRKADFSVLKLVNQDQLPNKKENPCFVSASVRVSFFWLLAVFCPWPLSHRQPRITSTSRQPQPIMAVSIIRPEQSGLCGLGGGASPTLVLFTNEIGTTGTYFVTGTVLLQVASGDAGYCYLTTAFEGGGALRLDPAVWATKRQL